MKLLKASFKNFRAYINESIDFSTDNNKNITLIVGENGTGKSTLLKGIVWSLYQENLFTDPSTKKEEELINSIVKEELKVGLDTIVEVRTTLEHHNKIYEFKTSQVWVLDLNHKPMIRKPTESLISITDENGKTTTLTQINSMVSQPEIEKILKSDLIPYFFVDGENSNITQFGNKKNLKEAVNKIMGMDVYFEIEKLLNPSANNYVYNRINNRLLLNINGEILKLNQQIEKLKDQNELDYIVIEELTNEINDLEKSKAQKKTLLSQLDQVKDYQQEKATKENELKRLISDLTQELNINFFSEYSSNFFIQDRIINVLQNNYKFLEFITEVSKKYDKEKSLSHISAEAIDQIVERGICICGTKISDNNDAIFHLEDIKNYIAPRNYSKGLIDIYNEFTTRFFYNQTTLEKFNRYVVQIDLVTDEIEKIFDRISFLDKKVAGQPDARILQNEIEQLQQDIFYKSNQLDIKNKDIEARNKSISELKLQIDYLLPKNEQNRINLLRRNYIEYLHKRTQDTIDEKKDEILKVINLHVSEIFDSMYFEDQRTIYIDQNYNVKTKAKNGNLDGAANMGALAVANFAFIAAIIKASKGFSSEIDKSIGIREESVYPLLMDSPFATLGQYLMSGVARNIYKVCDQMILFIKENDYKQIKLDLDEHVGKMYSLSLIKNSIQNCQIKGVS